MFDEQSISITRLKGSKSGIHQLQLDEIEALLQLREKYSGHYHLFVGERGKKLTTGAIAKIMMRARELAELPFPVHPYMMRHGCGFYLTEQGLPTWDMQADLGHKNIQHTVRYTAAHPARFALVNWQVVVVT